MTEGDRVTPVRLDHLLNDRDLARELRADVRAGMATRPRSLPPRWFYDARGSDLFDEITRLPEYYPTRAERAVLTRHAADIAAITGAKTLVELGSGASDKTRLLLGALHTHGTLGAFVPLDVSAAALSQALPAVALAYPDVQVRGIVGDFTRHLGALPTGSDRLVAFLGGTIGNLLPDQRAEFLRALRGELAPGEWFLLGADLVKDPATLVPAYDDAAGVTAEFNRNVLNVVNRELGGDFDPAGFDHVARWDPNAEWIEMRLRARRAHTVRLTALDLTLELSAGEELLTEISAKFRREGLHAELASAGFAARGWWTDPDGLFAVTLAQAV